MTQHFETHSLRRSESMSVAHALVLAERMLRPLSNGMVRVSRAETLRDPHYFSSKLLKV
ncbi:MAG: hypothetical protein QME59_00525 [Candidatus Hydrothermarchaeota archaeon]|nr:hypothetical protein [Candidatus Hydrothermarchaeota archaeon]